MTIFLRKLSFLFQLQINFIIIGYLILLKLPLNYFSTLHDCMDIILHSILQCSWVSYKMDFCVNEKLVIMKHNEVDVWINKSLSSRGFKIGTQMVFRFLKKKYIKRLNRI